MLFATVLVALGCVLTHSTPPAISGPYKTQTFKFSSPVHDASNQDVYVTAPVAEVVTGGDNLTFPLIAYAHGFLGGGVIDIHGYGEFFHQLSSWGFVVAAHASCNTGCAMPYVSSRWNSCGGLPEMKPSHGWNSFYSETLKTIEFARNNSQLPPFDLINFSLGVAIAGHSMGGQSTAYAAGSKCTDEWDIRAAALHHPADGTNGASGRNIGENITVPLAAFTSTGDHICDASLARAIYSATPSSTPRLYRNVIGSSHLEPVLLPPIESPYLAYFTAAWFSIHVGQSTGRAGPGSTAYEAIYGTGPSSVCGYAKMADCSA
jgi:hypothetical protein